MFRVAVIADVVKSSVHDIWCSVRAVAIVVVKSVGVVVPGLRRDSLGHLLSLQRALLATAGTTAGSGTSRLLLCRAPAGSVAAYMRGGKASGGPQPWGGDRWQGRTE